MVIDKRTSEVFKYYTNRYVLSALKVALLFIYIVRPIFCKLFYITLVLFSTIALIGI